MGGWVSWCVGALVGMGGGIPGRHLSPLAPLQEIRWICQRDVMLVRVFELHEQPMPRGHQPMAEGVRAQNHSRDLVLRESVNRVEKAL